MPADSPPLTQPSTFLPALKHCIATHPMLSAAIHGDLTESPTLVRPATLDLANHIDILNPITPAPSPSSSDAEALRAELAALAGPLVHAHDQPFTNCDRAPPWKVVVVPLATAPRSFWLLFAYSHSHGDGPSGLTFHRTFLDGLRFHSEIYDAETAWTPPPTPALAPPLEDVAALPVSWGYLLAPVLGTYLPASVAGWLGMRGAVAPAVDGGAWVGGRMRYDAADFRTGVAFGVVAGEVVRGVVGRCRERGAKATGVVHRVVVRVLGRELAAVGVGERFVAQTAMDLRGVVGADFAEVVGLCVSVAYHEFKRGDGGEEEDVTEWVGSEGFWEKASETTAQLKERAGTLVDQPIGLLKYLRSMRPWLEGQIGKERDSSYEISNLMVFDPEVKGKKVGEAAEGWKIDGVVFSQPANATGSPVNFNVVTMKGGDMVVALTWQRGVLGVGEDEDGWARRVCEGVEEGLRAVARVRE